jgi:hypothetical protein
MYVDVDVNVDVFLWCDRCTYKYPTLFSIAILLCPATGGCGEEAGPDVALHNGVEFRLVRLLPDKYVHFHDDWGDETAIVQAWLKRLERAWVK